MSTLRKNISTDSLVRSEVAALDFLRASKAATGRKDNKLGRMFTAVLFAFVIIFLLIIISMGILVYGAVNDVRTSNNETRMGLSLIANTVRMNDKAGSVRKADGPQGPALVLTESSGDNSYETRIYLYNGSIVAESWIASHAFTPETADVIVPSKTFSFDLEGDLLTVHTDQGTIEIALRSENAGVL